MDEQEYLARDAIGLAELVAAREVSAAEVLEAAIARAEAVEPKINALTQRLYERARAEAANGGPTGPLGGVPYLLKDLSTQLAGAQTRAGSRLFDQAPPAAADSALVAAYRRAGLVIFGKTNTPEFGLEPVTEPEAFGPTRNPWDPSRTAGGSSGGSAAAVAAGVVPAAQASDGGGSIRIPASCCGLFGMKPSRGRVSMAPADEGWAGLSCLHAVTRTVRDSALLLDISSRPAPGDPYWAPPDGSFLEASRRDPARLKVGFTTAALRGDGLDPECARAVEDTARLLEGLGHTVEEARLPADANAIGDAVGLIVTANIAAVLDTEADRRRRPIVRGDVEDLTFGMYERGKAITAPAYIRAVQAAHAFGRAVAPFFETYDVLLLSTLGRPPVPLKWLRGDPPDLEGYNKRLFDFMPNTAAFNVTGQPAMTVPLATSGEGLPIGVQFVGRPAGEAGLFALAGQLERAAPWADRRPSI
ncbi:MAG TPA: amidase [Caulobacteraceae bacterium]|nr:amidase [Caulobacteraceae bacterium]